MNKCNSELPNKLSKYRRRQAKTVEQNLDVSVEVDNNVLPEIVSERISEQGGVIEVPETASQGRRLQRTVEQYLDVSVEVDKDVFPIQVSGEMRDQISRKHQECYSKLCGFWCALSLWRRGLAALR